MFKLENKFIKVEIKKTGVELKSLYSKETEIEYLWQGDPSVWAGQAPILFPIIGCLKNNEFIFDDNYYQTPKHGFVRHNNDFVVKSSSDTSITFSLMYNEDLLKIFPFKFEFLVTYTIEKNSICVSHRVINLDNKAIYFSIGGHTAFNCPLVDNEEYSDYYLEFEKEETCDKYEVLKNGLIGNSTFPLLNNSKIINLHNNIFENDALVLKDLKSRNIILKNIKNRHEISVEYNDFPYLGIWAKPNSRFVCIEPWLGISDSVDSNQNITDKEGIIKLKQCKEYIASFTIKIS